MAGKIIQSNVWENEIMIRKHPPHKMLSLLVILLVMLSYFSFDLCRSKDTPKRPMIPETKNITVQPDQNLSGNLQNQSNIDEVESNRPEEQSIRPSTILIIEKMFTRCGHIIRNQSQTPSDLVNLTEKQLKLAYKDWIIKKFSPEKVIISQNIDSKCPNHFILKAKDGLVAVYYQTPVNDISLKEVTPILVENLRSKDKERLESGIKIESQQELAQALEDLGS